MKALPLALALALCAGCAVPKFIISDTFVGTRNDAQLLGEKSLLVPSFVAGPGANQQALYDYVLRLCTVDSQGTESQCTDSVVLQNVISGSLW